MPVRSLHDLRWAEPELYACLLLLGGEMPSAPPAGSSINEQQLLQALSRQLQVVGEAIPSDMRLFFAYRSQPTATGVAFGHTVLLLLPKEVTVPPAEAARAAAVAWLASLKRPAAPREDVPELLLLLAEGLVWQGIFALANTPAELLPVSQWLEPKQVLPALAALAQEFADKSTPYRVKRARLRELQKPGAGDLALAQAAAYLLEVFGKPERARVAPIELLQAWKDNQGSRFPPMPKPFRRALENPHSLKARKEDLEAMVLDAALRAAMASPPDQALPKDAPQEAKVVWEARRRAVGLSTDVPEGIVPGEGFLLSRPEKGDFAVYWRHGSQEILLFLWPRWVLSPHLSVDGKEVTYVDPSGVWRVNLAGTVVEKVLDGNFRLALASPLGTHLAVMVWPSKRLLVVPPGKTFLAAEGRFVWFGDDLLLVSDGEAIRAVNLQGEAAALMTLPCGVALSGNPNELWALTDNPCEPTLFRLNLPQRQVIPLLSLQDAPVDVLPLPQGQVLILTSRGVLAVKDGQVRRLTLAFAIGSG